MLVFWPLRWHPSFNLPMSLHPLTFPTSSSPVDHADPDREQFAAGVPAGWGAGRSRAGRSWRWRRGSLGREWDASRDWCGRCSWVWAGSRPPGAVTALLCGPPLPSPSTGPPGRLNVWARGSPRPHGPRSPSSGLPDSSPAAPQHTQCKLDPQTLYYRPFVNASDWLCKWLCTFQLPSKPFSLSSPSFSSEAPVVPPDVVNKSYQKTQYVGVVGKQCWQIKHKSWVTTVYSIKYRWWSTYCRTCPRPALSCSVVKPFLLR